MCALETKMLAVELNAFNITAYATGALLVLYILRGLYRISPLHPLAKIPGSRLAAMTQWYEIYKNVIQDGQFIFKTIEWHEKYGPIIRIGPNEVHINEPSFYNTLYSKDYRFNKYRPHYHFAQQKEAGVANNNVVTHKAHRKILNPLFTNQSVTKLEPRIKKYVDMAAARIGRTMSSKEGFEISTVFRCLTIDIISEYAYSESFGMLENDKLDDPLHTAMDDLCRLVWFNRWTPYLQDALRALPFSIVKRIMPEKFLGVVFFQMRALDIVNTFLADPEKAKAKYTHTTVFEVLLHGNHAKGYKVPSVNALKEEAWGLMSAGSETTASVLTNGIYEACKKPHIQDELYAELLAAFPDPDNDPITWKRTLALPYLVSFIKESLRLPAGVPGRLPRVVPPGGVTVCGQFLPEGTQIGMSAILQMNDPNVFKDPKKFEPERWIRDNIPTEYFVPFGKGSRGCQGMSLAWAELYLMFAVLFRKYRFEIHEDSTFTDNWSDQFIPKREGHLLVRTIPRE